MTTFIFVCGEERDNHFSPSALISLLGSSPYRKNHVISCRARANYFPPQTSAVRIITALLGDPHQLKRLPITSLSAEIGISSARSITVTGERAGEGGGRALRG
ncbi:hypothetical protein RRG08_054748 [Elysia crispata]|uniref:Uncharacterized protein n=1 Tax=Elysia crispata TaxID=231223 RepID=A0AAE1E841_9GAST|nr:hypothetical protein RRG08_054748 [Elysia crispata]